MKETGFLRRMALCAAALALCGLVGACASIRKATVAVPRPDAAAAVAPETPEQQITALVAAFQDANQTGDYRALRRMVTGEMKEWVERSGVRGWREDLVDAGSVSASFLFAAASASPLRGTSPGPPSSPAGQRPTNEPLTNTSRNIIDTNLFTCIRRPPLYLKAALVNDRSIYYVEEPLNNIFGEFDHFLRCEKSF